MKKNVCFIFLLLGILNLIKAQQVMTPDEAVSIALKNNYDILVALNDAAIDSINNTAGNAGMLPSLAVNGTGNYAVNNVHQKNQNGVETSYSGIRVNAINVGPALNWTLFDGGKMFVTKKRLSEIEALGELQFKVKVMQTVYEVILAYYDVVRQKQQLSSIKVVIAYNLENVKILGVSFDAGLTPKTNLLQAKIDLNVYQENAINQQSVILNSKRTLNGLLGRDPSVAFEVADSIPLSYTPDSTMLLQKLYSTNTAVLAAQKQVDVARLITRENTSLLFPKVNVTAGYNFNFSNNAASPIVSNRTNGVQFGGSFSIPLFQGGNTLREIKTSKIQVLTAQDQFENTKLQVNMQLQNALMDFENQKNLLHIEKDNALLAKENLDISTQRLRYGQTTTLEVHLAQDSYVQSLTRLLNFEYNLKAAETRLKQLLAEL